MNEKQLTALLEAIRSEARRIKSASNHVGQFPAEYSIQIRDAASEIERRVARALQLTR